MQKTFNHFLGSIFLWMTAGLLISAVSGYALIVTGLIAYLLNPFAILALGFIEIILIISLRKDKNRNGKLLKYIIYSIMTGVTFSVISLTYTKESIIIVFFSTAILFALLATFALFTNINFNKFSNILFIGLIAVILIGLVNLFVGSSLISLILSIVTLVLFLFLTIRDIQNIEKVYNNFNYQNELTLHEIDFALSLYLDFVNIFLSLLRLFGKKD